MLVALLLAAAALQPQTPQAFITHLYAQYRHERFDPFDHIDAIFARPLAAAIRLDAKLTPRGYAGALDWDPICSCQDSEGLRAEIQRIVPATPNRVTAMLTLHYAGTPPTQSARLILERTLVGWRVLDVRMGDGRSLLAFLNGANREAINQHHRR